MHRILERQIKRSFGDNFTSPPEWSAFLTLVSDTYTHLDEDRALLDRSLEISSKEFLENSKSLNEAKEELERRIKERSQDLEKYQTLVNNLTAGVYRNNPAPDGHFLEANPAIISMFEADSKEEFLKHNASDLYPDKERRKLFVEKIMKNGFVKDEELDLLTLKGKPIIGSISAVVKKNNDGTIYIDGIIEDITDRKKAEDVLKKAHAELEIKVKERTVELNKRVQELEDTRRAMTNLLEDFDMEKKRSGVIAQELEKFKLAVDNVSDTIIISDASGVVIYANRAVEKVTGYTPEEAVGKKSGSLWKTPMPREYYQKLWDTIKKQKKMFNGEIQNKRKNGEMYIAAISISPILNKNGDVVFFVGIERDISREKEIDRLKDEFVSIASHELRTPLTAIDGLVSMIRDGEYGQIDTNLQQPLEDINTSSERLIRLVNDLLNLSRIKAGRMKYTLSDFSILDVIVETVNLLTPISKRKGLQLVTVKLEPVKVQADPEKVKEILNNLIGNALKFTDSGSITVSTKKIEGTIVVYVSDTGIGIAKEDRGKLFGLFQQLESGIGRPIGTGLGLHISKELVSKMGGSLWLEESKVGVGSTFAFSLPQVQTPLAAKVLAGIGKEAKAHPDQKSDGVVHTIHYGASA